MRVGDSVTLSDHRTCYLLVSFLLELAFSKPFILVLLVFTGCAPCLVLFMVFTGLAREHYPCDWAVVYGWGQK